MTLISPCQNMEILGLSLDDTYPPAEGDLAYLVFYNQGKTLTASSDENVKIADAYDREQRKKNK